MEENSPSARESEESIYTNNMMAKKKTFNEEQHREELHEALLALEG